MKRNEKISVVVPVYHSQNTLARTHQEIVKALLKLKTPFEIIYVDDGSTDFSWRTLQSIKDQSPYSITIVQLMRNYGQHNATLCGLRRASGQWIFTLDDDGQTPPNALGSLLDKIRKENLDLAYGIYEKKKHAVWRNLGSTLINCFFQRVFQTKAQISSYRVIRRELLDSILDYPLSFTYLDGLLAWNTVRIGNVTVPHFHRKVGKSGYSLAKLFSLALNMFCNFSIVPLQFLFILGTLVAVPSLLVAGFYFVRYLTNDIVVPGYASTILAILIIGGVQLLGIGLLGQYLGRLYLTANRKPQYTERQAYSSAARSELGTEARVWS